MEKTMRKWMLQMMLLHGYVHDNNDDDDANDDDDTSNDDD